MSPQIAELLADAYLADRKRETAALQLIRAAERAGTAAGEPRAAGRPARGLWARRPMAWFVREV